MGISVLISTYYGEDPEDVDACLKSTFTQTLLPDEVVIVKDGPLPPGLDQVVDSWADEYPNHTKVVALDENMGTGKALQAGFSECTQEFIAKVDSDDISVKDRFEKEEKYLRENPDIAVVGGYMKEIQPDGTEMIREVPESPEKLRSFARHRSPVNHPTSMYRRSSVNAVGGYRNLESMQDYDLWIRLLNDGYQLANIPEVLVETSISEDWYYRRGGVQYAILELKLLYEFYNIGFLNLFDLIINIAGKTPLRILPKKARQVIYHFILRE